MRLIKWNDVINFGKYKGKTWVDVYYIDASYLIWCHNNVEWLQLPEYLVARVVRKAIEQLKEKRVMAEIIDIYDYYD
jgi:hypothetical protein